MRSSACECIFFNHVHRLTVNMASAFTTLCKLPELNTVTVLLVGTQGIGKHELAKALVDINTAFSLEVRIATHLPLPSDNEKSRPSIDYIVFIMDANNQMSISNVASSLKALDVSYFLGHTCFVVLNAADTEALHGIHGLCDTYDSPVVCGSLKDDRLKKCLAERILKLSKTAAGYAGVSPLLIQATQRRFEFVTEL